MAPEKTPQSQPDKQPTRTWDQQRGAVRLRRARNCDDTTTDQRLLDSRGPSDWAHTDPWRVLRIQSEFVEGFGALSEVPRAVSVFGSARTTPGSQHYESARQIGEALVNAGYAVITGGGPGVMEAANRGASEADGFSIGLGIELPFESGLNDWVDLGVNFRYFFVRKTMFLKYSQAFICLPGGFGTLDEMFESLTLVQTGKVTRFPIILFGSSFWAGLIQWIRDQLVENGTISPADLSLIHVTDSVDEVIRIINEAQDSIYEALSTPRQ
ncbi:TIGR00730 family Rossman fold protein [Hoyosella rhizosphaerae]|uniref:Cytokinin riboside 5'-monophosphate phosphoribohydrolase n=1 Tax=Hoyosella rhizosphaerae TaxID=1755582 RepID=A0A916UDU4_9ACTN|nr:TIGR00730 family Rossman fold protein [Hoyosella rhizosphaerae]MBN4925606.1 TIGR00730 family Rossman fold protein [Hoyosella rhizosphaerae]GGC69330.1 cytokinin riboside 5'-monophosphate phosphoribohydrolase [Hoyosella rhizosphaerae]